MPRSRPTEETRATARNTKGKRTTASSTTRAVTRKTTSARATAADSRASERGTGGATSAVGGIQLGARQLSEALTAPMAAVGNALTALAEDVPAVFFTKMKRSRVPHSSTGFIIEMASVREQYAAELGHLAVDPRALEQGAALGAAANTAIGPLQGLLNVLQNIRDYSLGTALKDGRLIYRRAVNVAETNADLARAIAPYRSARVRAGKKAAATRRRRGSETPTRTPTPTPTPADGLTTTTTTTTSKK